MKRTANERGVQRSVGVEEVCMREIERERDVIVVIVWIEVCVSRLGAISKNPQAAAANPSW